MKKHLTAVLLGILLICGTVPVEAQDHPHKPKRTWRDYFRGSSKKKHIARKETLPKDDAEIEEYGNPEGVVDLVDIPTTNVIDYGAFRMNFRLYSSGGLVSHLSFGVFRRLNLGASWDNEKVIGSDDPTTNTPTLNIKLRVYDGGQILPSFAIGYDGQGRFFNRAVDEYQERERGLYGVLGREMIFPGLELLGGVNIAQFKEGLVFGFIGTSYTIEQKVVLFTEYDNIRKAGNNRWNAGIRFFPIPSLGIDFAIRRIASDQNKERIIRINYVGKF